MSVMGYAHPDYVPLEETPTFMEVVADQKWSPWEAKRPRWTQERSEDIAALKRKLGLAPEADTMELWIKQK